MYGIGMVGEVSFYIKLPAAARLRTLERLRLRSFPVLFVLSRLVRRWLVYARLIRGRGVAILLTTMVNPFPNAIEMKVVYFVLEVG